MSATLTAITTETVREILNARRCTAACACSEGQARRCRCRCAGQFHGYALDAIGDPGRPAAVTKPATPGKNRTARKRWKKRR